MESKVYMEALEEFRILQQRTSALKERIDQYPPGFLKINHKNGRVQYYHVIKDSSKGGKETEERRYIRKKDQARAFLLAQKSHDIRLLKELEIRQEALVHLLEAYSGTDPYAIWDEYSDARKELIDSDYVSDEQYAKKWQEKQYRPKDFPENAPEIYTIKGERVRSKSEKIIADTLERYRIPYRYEFPVELSHGVLIHPDFHVLNKRTRREYFWEHLGMVDDPEYYSNAVRRLEQMAENGIFPGKNLILTAETGARALNIKMLNTIMKEYLF